MARAHSAGVGARSRSGWGTPPKRAEPKSAAPPRPDALKQRLLNESKKLDDGARSTMKALVESEARMVGALACTRGCRKYADVRCASVGVCARCMAAAVTPRNGHLHPPGHDPLHSPPHSKTKLPPPLRKKLPPRPLAERDCQVEQRVGRGERLRVGFAASGVCREARESECGEKEGALTEKVLTTGNRHS